MVRNMTVKEEAYQYLTSIKQKDQSYSDVILRLKQQSQKETLASFFGIWKGKKVDTVKLRKKTEVAFHARV